jgi:hypothetical protein
MMWLRNLIARGNLRRPATRWASRLEFEVLEDRVMPALTFHGGNLLPHVEVQALYLGSDWLGDRTLAQQKRVLDGFLPGLVGGPYMDVLTAAGYGVGRGTASAGATDPVLLNKNDTLPDAAIRIDVQLAIGAHLLQPPSPNRLYVVFVEDNVDVQTDDGYISRTDFLGYHGAFAGHDAAGHAADIRYAVVAYPGGDIGNAGVLSLSSVNDMTEVASHEIIEAVTDPDVNYSALGWYDDTLNDENADITNQQFVMLGGFAVQRIPDLNDQPITPPGAAPQRPVTFVLLRDGRLYEHTASGWTYLCSGVASVSDQGIDNTARALVDIVLTNGRAYEYHDVSGWVSLGSGVKDARAGQGVSYVLLSTGRLFEYQDATASWSGLLASSVASIDAGTNRYAVNLVDAVSRSGALSEYSDSSGGHTLHTGVQAVSAGIMGISAVLLTDHRAYEYQQGSSHWLFLGGSVAQIAIGTDPTGAAIIDLLYENGTVAEQRARTGWKTLAVGAKSVSKARAGRVDVVFANGNAYEHTAATWSALCGYARAAV